MSSRGADAQSAGGMQVHAERGAALVIAMAVMLLISAVTAGLVLTTSSEARIAVTYRTGVEALYAADAIAEWAIAELETMPDWTPLVDGLVTSSFIDGPPAGTHRMRDGRTVDLLEAMTAANCATPAICSSTDGSSSSTGYRPPDAPVWRLFAYGPLEALLPTIQSPFYVLVMVAAGASMRGDDQAESSGERPPRPDLVLLRAEAFGPRDAHRTIELAVMHILASADERDDGARSSVLPIRVVSWREM